MSCKLAICLLMFVVAAKSRTVYDRNKLYQDVILVDDDDFLADLESALDEDEDAWTCVHLKPSNQNPMIRVNALKNACLATCRKSKNICQQECLYNAQKAVLKEQADANRAFERCLASSKSGK